MCIECHVNKVVFHHTMETYVRGFSYMPTNKVELVNIQDALERTWKNTRRERLKQREQKIWEEFVKDNDIVNTVCEDDQYQFLDQLPESCVQQIMETELMKIKQANQIAQDHKAAETPQEDKTIVETTHEEKEDCDMFNIFDDEKDEESPNEDGVLNDSMNSAPATVREKPQYASEDVQLEQPSSENTISAKSSENFSNVIESSIYCAKVKDTRIKINEEVLDMLTLLDRRQLFSMEREDIARMIKRSAEFCARFNRIYLYQLQRQMQDIKRNNNLTLPFAKHTQFQSQMVRIVSLHQNLLQSFQVFRRSMEQTCCVRESVSALGELVGAARAATSQCAAVTHPKDLIAAHQLYEDSLLASCDKLEHFVNEYAVRCEEFLMGFANVVTARPHKTKETKKTKRRPLLNLRNHSKANSEADSRLSMYSLGTIRLNPKSSSSKDVRCNPQKSRSTLDELNAKETKPVESNKTERKSPRTRRKSPRSRRPLMRDPNAGAPRVRRASRASRVMRDDIPTMVEGVMACASTNNLTEDSSLPAPPKFTKEDTIRKHIAPSPRKHKILNPKHTKAFIQAENQETTFTTQPSNSKLTIHKNSNKAEKKKEEEIKREEGNNVEAENNIDVGNRASAESSKFDSARSSTTKSKSHRSGSSQKLEPIKAVTVRPAAVKLETTVHSESPKTEPLYLEFMKLETKKLHSPKPEVLRSPYGVKPQKLNSVEEKKEKRERKLSRSPDQCEVTKLLQQLCSGDPSGTRTERTTGTKNAQLLYVNGTSPRPQPSTPQLLRILEETIQKKIPKSLLKKLGPRDMDKYRLNFNIGESVTDNMFQYRTKFVQHMLSSPMYANSAVGKPWEMIGSVSEQIIDELLVKCVMDMELNDYVLALYKLETS